MTINTVNVSVKSAL